MATGKRYYWIKLKENFMNSDLVDHIMALPHGAEYLVIYQLLCLKAINSKGRLELQLGETRIPFTPEKLRRDFLWFQEKRIMEALDLLKEGHLIDMEADGTVVINHFDDLVGSETDHAIQKRQQRTDASVPHAKTADTLADIVRTEIDTETEKEKELEYYCLKERDR